MEGNHDHKNFLSNQMQNLRLLNPTSTESTQNKYSVANATGPSGSFTSEVPQKSPELASNTSQSPATGSSKSYKVQLSPSASVFIPNAKHSLSNGYASSNDHYLKTANGFDNSHGFVAERPMPILRHRNDRVLFEQTAEYHGVHFNNLQPENNAQTDFPPLLAHPATLTSLPSNAADPGTANADKANDTAADDPALPRSAKLDWFLPTEMRDEIKSMSGVPESADDILSQLGLSAVPDPSYQVEEYHKQPHVPSLTRLLQLATEDRNNRDSRVKALESSQEALKAQVIYLTRINKDLRSNADATADLATKFSVELDDSKKQLSAVQDRIDDLEIELVGMYKEKEDATKLLQRRADWWKLRARTLQFVEGTELQCRIVKLEGVIGGLKSDTICNGRKEKLLKEQIKTLKEKLDTQVINSAAEKDELLKKFDDLQIHLGEKAWQARKAEVEAGKGKMQQLEDAMIKENSRGREIARNAANAQGPTPSLAKSSPRSGSNSESGSSRTSYNLPAPPPHRDRWEPVGRDEYMYNNWSH